MSLRSHKRLRLGVESMEPRLCLSAVTFVLHDVTFGEGIEAPDFFAGEWVDMDADGDLDLFQHLHGHVREPSRPRWLENVDGEGALVTERDLSEFELHDGIRAVATLDIDDYDGDRDLDVLIQEVAESGAPSYLSWLELDNGVVSEKHTIDGGGDYGLVAALDFDGDSDIDLAFEDEGFLNDGQGNFTKTDDLLSGRRLENLYWVDIDGDADRDLLVIRPMVWLKPGIARWYEMTEIGLAQAARELEFAGGEFPFGDGVQAIDVDGDGDMDLVHDFGSYEGFGDQILLYQRLSPTTFGQQTALSEGIVGRWDFVPFDVGSDGDQDIVFVEHCLSIVEPQCHVLGFIETTDGTQPTMKRDVIELPFLSDVYETKLMAGDLDGNKDVEFLLYANDAWAWFEIRAVGDSNGDGDFDSSDLATVFQTGKFEDGIPDNATFDDGDWNQDGDFDSSDLVFAFQNGEYN